LRLRQRHFARERHRQRRQYNPCFFHFFSILFSLNFLGNPKSLSRSDTVTNGPPHAVREASKFEFVYLTDVSVAARVPP
jgi:hypothetical protein